MAYTGNLFYSTPAGINGDRGWKYSNSSDTLTQIKASGYFNSVTNVVRRFDTIEIHGSDGKQFVFVNSASGAPTVTTAAFEDDSVPALPTNQLFLGNASNVATAVAMSGDATIVASGALTIAAGAIDNGKISATADIEFSKLENLNNSQILVGSAGNRATAVTMSGDVAISATGATTLQPNSVDNNNIKATAGINFSKLEALPSGQMLVGNPGNQAAAVAMSGDATLSNSGVLSLVAGAVDAQNVSNYTVDDVVAGISTTLVFDLAGNGATTNEDKTLTYGLNITGFKVINRGNGSLGDTVQLQTGSGVAISDILSVGGANNSFESAHDLHHSNTSIASGGTLRFRLVDGGGNDRPPVRVIVEGVKIA